MKTLYVFAGNNGSGKSTYRSLMKNEIFSELDIDNDYIERILRSDNVLNPKKESGKRTISQVKDCMNRGMNFSFETTLSSKLSLRQIKEARSKGYYIIMYYLFLDGVELNIERVRLRHLKGGHSIPKDDIIRRNSRSVENLIAIKDEIDEIYIINNTGKNGVMVAKVIEGELAKLEGTVPSWLDWL
ncbi:zeta toxin family protein [Lederbergia sp. NSJ-179]|uniref:zeta toxin family protein n=1 Tax=Lederbergia sp. NSJ-179 TaxID=2931402 RepID=UPI001FD14444|nr:zeta toxin family protein [Lederbergia sp. NSJ-179]MCJ7842701.1 zeta toxin family protein [Lederbergia sp. NSJ-179]